MVPGRVIADGPCIRRQMKGSRRLVCATAPGSNWRPSKAEVRRIIRRQHNPCSTTLADRL